MVVAWPGAGFLPTAVLSDEAGQETGGNCLEWWDRGGKDADVGFDNWPVHGTADGVGGVLWAEHGRDVGDSDDWGDASAAEDNMLRMVQAEAGVHLQETKAEDKG